MLFSEFRLKEVINTKTCKILGNVCDLSFEKNGCIKDIIVPGPAKYCGCFGRDSEYIIPFCSIENIGDDIILVCVEEKECLKKVNPKEKCKDIFF